MIGILATGDELISGDILNTNGQFIAQTLFQHNIPAGMQLTIRDDQAELEDGMHYLLGRHNALITIGSDDRTRFALARVLDQELVFDEASWHAIQTRLHKRYTTIPQSNRQQCLFPEAAHIMPNEHGTANGCYLIHQGKLIFMLPGPPHECKPLVELYVLPQLIQHGFVKTLYKAHWKLTGISESHLAEQLDPIAQQFNVRIGYRAVSPYIELKLFSSQNDAFLQAKIAFIDIIKPYIVTREP